MAHDIRLKFIIIGDSGCGKSSIRTRFMDNKFSYESVHTVGVEFSMKTINIGDRKCQLQIWDTAGQERFYSVTRSYYRGALGCLLLYDITQRETYNNVAKWMNDAKAQAGQDMVVMLVGNKSDLQEDREVTFLEASRFAQENEMLFLETSAKTGEGVEEAFLTSAKIIVSRIDDGKLIPPNGSTSALSPQNTATTSSCSC